MVSEGKKKKASQVQVLNLLFTGSISYLIFPSHGQVFHLQNGHKNSPCLFRLRRRENKTTAVKHPAQSLTQELEAIFSSISSFTQLNASIAPTGVLLNACRFLLSISFFPVWLYLLSSFSIPECWMWTIGRSSQARCDGVWSLIPALGSRGQQWVWHHPDLHSKFQAS